MSILDKIRKTVFDADISTYTQDFKKLFPQLVEATNDKIFKESNGQLSLESHGGSVRFEHLWDSFGDVLLAESVSRTGSIKYSLVSHGVYITFTYIKSQDQLWYFDVKLNDVLAARKSLEAVNTYMQQEIEKLRGK